jgi:hypothetical protein
MQLLMRPWFLVVCTGVLWYVSGNEYDHVAVSTTVQQDENQPQRQEQQLRGVGANRTLQVTLGTITKFRLINALTDTPIMDLRPNIVLNLATLPTTKLNIEAVTSGFIGSIRFAFVNSPTFMTDSVAPFALGDERAGSFEACPELAIVGQYTIKATPYSIRAAGGTSGAPLEINFKIVDQSCRIPQVRKMIQQAKMKSTLNFDSFAISLNIYLWCCCVVEH